METRISVGSDAWITRNRVRTYSLETAMSEDVRTRELQTDTVDQPRRRFFGTAAMTIAAAQLGLIASAGAQTGKAASTVSAIKPDTNTSFKSLKQINASAPVADIREVDAHNCRPRNIPGQLRQHAPKGRLCAQIVPA
jgi:hypothetical protein